MTALLSRLAILCALLSLAACSGTLSTQRRDQTAYVVTAAQAQKIVDTAIRANVPASAVNPGPAGTLSCSATIRKFLVTTNVHAAAVRARTFTPDGKLWEGYVFLVSYWSSTPFPSLPFSVYRSIQQDAAAQGRTFLVKR